MSISEDYKNNIWKMYLIKFFSGIHFIGAVLIPFFMTWGKLEFSQILILQSFFMLFIFLFEVPTGAVADYLGRKVSIFLGAGINAVATIIYASFPNFYVFLLGELLFALGVALISGADQAILYDSLKKVKLEKQSKKIFGRWQSFHLAGIFVGPIIGSVIAVNLGLQWPMLLTSIPTGIAALIVLTIKEPKTRKKIESRRYVDVLVKGFKFFVKHKELKILALDYIFVASISYFLIWTYQLVLQRIGINVAYFGIVHALLVLSQIIIINNYSKVERLVGSKSSFLAISALILGIGFIVAGLTNYIPIVLISIILAAGFGLGRKPAFNSYMNKYIPSKERATIISSISMFSTFVLIVLNPIIGKAVEWSLNITLIILGVSAIIFTLFSRIEEKILID